MKQYRIAKSKILKSQSKSMDSTKTKIKLNICFKFHIVVNYSKFRVTKYLYINDSKPRCEIFFNCHNNVKQPRQNT